MVVKWIDPRPGSGYLSLYSKIQRMSALIRRWRNGGQIIENLNSMLLQSTSAALVGSARSWDFLLPLPTQRSIFHLGWASVPAFVTLEHSVECVWMPHWPGNSVASSPDMLWWYLSGYLHIWCPLVTFRLTQIPKNPLILGLLEMNPILLGLSEIILKWFLLYVMNTCCCIKRAYRYKRVIGKYVCKEWVRISVDERMKDKRERGGDEEEWGEWGGVVWWEQWECWWMGTGVRGERGVVT